MPLVTQGVVEGATAELQELRESGAHPNDIRLVLSVKNWLSERLGQEVERTDLPGRRSIDVRVIALLEGTVSDVKAAISGLSDVELRLASEREACDRDRSTLLAAIDAETEKRRC